MLGLFFSSFYAHAFNDVSALKRQKDTHPSHVGHLRKSQSKGSRPHGPSVPEGASAVKLVPGRLENIAELGGGELFQHMDDSTAVATVWGFTVLLSEPLG